MKVIDQFCSADFFVLFPCLVCHSTSHTTAVCGLLHGLCQLCHKRGHDRGLDCAHPEMAKAKFDRYARFGYQTHTAQKDTDMWGLTPSHYFPAPIRQAPTPHMIIDSNGKARNISDFSKFIVEKNFPPTS